MHIQSLQVFKFYKHNIVKVGKLRKALVVNLKKTICFIILSVLVS